MSEFENEAPETIGRHGGWTFDPAREIWWAKTGPSTWTEVPGAIDNPPRFPPAPAPAPAGWRAHREIPRFGGDPADIDF